MLQENLDDIAVCAVTNDLVVQNVSWQLLKCLL